MADEEFDFYIVARNAEDMVRVLCGPFSSLGAAQVVLPHIITADKEVHEEANLVNETVSYEVGCVPAGEAPPSPPLLPTELWGG